MKRNVEAVQCCVTVEDRANGRHYNLSRSFTTYPDKQCSRKAKLRIGKLVVCTVHARLCCEGFVSENGHTYPPSMVRDHRNARTRPEWWAEKLNPRPLR